jgi:hypothetical protein
MAVRFVGINMVRVQEASILLSRQVDLAIGSFAAIRWTNIALQRRRDLEEVPRQSAKAETQTLKTRHE